MKLVVGLGNIGKKYEKTRHNIGFRAVDAFLEEQTSGSFKNKDALQALLFTEHIANEKIVFLKPTTLMNRSGETVKRAMDYYNIPIQEVLVIHDDTALEFGTIRVRPDGSSGGHNGVESVIKACGKNFWRTRIGIGPVAQNYTRTDFVLSRFTRKEEEALPIVFKQSNHLVKSFITGALETQSVSVDI